MRGFRIPFLEHPGSGTFSNAPGATAASSGSTRPPCRRSLGAAPDGTAVLAGTVTKYTYLGREAHVQVETPAGTLVVQVANPGMSATREAGEAVSVLVPRDAPMAFGADGARIGG